MKLTESNILAELERLAQACPWDKVELWTARKPEGEYSFTAYITNNEELGFPYHYGHGKSPAEAVDHALRQAGSRDPEIMRRKKIKELHQNIIKLQAVVIGLPPYRPNRELCEVNVPETIEV